MSLKPALKATNRA